MNISFYKYYSILLIVTSIIGLFNSKKIQINIQINFISYFLIYLFLIEFIGDKLSQKSIPNVWLYNYSSIVEFAFYSWIIIRILPLKKSKNKLKKIVLIYCLIALINIIFFQGKTGFHSITFALGSILIITLCIYYFYQLLLFPNEEKLITQPNFWICTALLFSFTCSFPIFCLNNFYAHKISQNIWPIISSISNIINIIFCLLLIVAFVCRIKIKKFLPSLS